MFGSEIPPPSWLFEVALLVLKWFTNLLYPFWNHWWSLQSDWRSAGWVSHESHYFLLWITSVPNRVIHVLNHRVISVLNRTIFALYRVISVSNTKTRSKSLFASATKQTGYLINKKIGTYWFPWFQNGCTKAAVMELRAIQFWSEIILVFFALVRFRNHAYDFRPNCPSLSSITMINHQTNPEVITVVKTMS